MHVEKQMQIIELIISVGSLKIEKLNNIYFLTYRNEEKFRIENDTELSIALLNMLALLFNKNYFKNEEQIEQIKLILS